MEAIIKALKALLEEHRGSCPDCDMVKDADTALAEYAGLKVIVEVEGGCVTTMRANVPGITGIVLDHDNLLESDDQNAECEPDVSPADDKACCHEVWP